MGVAGFTQDTVGEMCLPEVAARDETAHLEAYQLAVNTSDNLNQFTLPTMYSDKHFESVKYVEQVNLSLSPCKLHLKCFCPASHSEAVLLQQFCTTLPKVYSHFHLEAKLELGKTVMREIFCSNSQ